jgi:hypothetical protein
VAGGTTSAWGDRARVAAVFGGAAGIAAAMNLWPRRAVPFVMDEFAYLLQARTFASWRLSLPEPPLREFFETVQVLVTPHYMAKYLPGNALFLAPFAALGIPWLWPCLAFGACAAFLYLALRQLDAPPLVAAFASALFATSSLNLGMFPTYLSHCTSTLAAMGALVLSSRAARLRSMGAAAAVGACASVALLTRPYTGIACAVASAVVLLQARAPLRAFGGLVAPFAVALALIFAFNARTTGSWRISGWELYARQYAPADRPGFWAVPERNALLPVPGHLRSLLHGYERDRVAYTPSSLPAAAFARLEWIFDYLPMHALILLALLSLACSGAPPVGFALAWLVALFMLGLTFHSGLPQYQIDEYAPLVVLVGAGLLAALRGLRRAHLVLPGLVALAIGFYASLFGDGYAAAAVLLVVAYGLGALVIRRRWRTLREWSRPALGGLAALLAAVTCTRMPGSARHSRMTWQRDHELREKFASLADGLRARPMLLFVHGTDEQLLQLPLVNPGLGAGNPQPLIAIDRGDRNAELVARFPEREALRLDVGTWSLERCCGRVTNPQATQLESTSR